jgi:hypothetical protein
LKVVALMSMSTDKEDLKMIDKWIVGNDPHLGRSEAIRERSEPEPTRRALKSHLSRAQIERKNWRPRQSKRLSSR